MQVMVSKELSEKIDFIYNDVILLENVTLTEKEQREFEILREIIRTAPQKRCVM